MTNKSSSKCYYICNNSCSNICTLSSCRPTIWTFHNIRYIKILVDSPNQVVVYLKRKNVGICTRILFHDSSTTRNQQISFPSYQERKIQTSSKRLFLCQRIPTQPSHLAMKLSVGSRCKCKQLFTIGNPQWTIIRKRCCKT